MATMELRQKKTESNPHTPPNRMGMKLQDTTLRTKKVNAATNTLSTHTHDVSVQACIKPNQKDVCIEACTYQWKLSTDKHIQTSVTYARNADMQTQTDEPKNTQELSMQTMCTSMNVVEAAMQTMCTSMNRIEAATQTEPTNSKTQNTHTQTDKVQDRTPLQRKQL